MSEAEVSDGFTQAARALAGLGRRFGVELSLMGWAGWVGRQIQEGVHGVVPFRKIMSDINTWVLHGLADIVVRSDCVSLSWPS